jgi:hypothetical protein
VAIEGVGSYIGKYKHISRPTQHYSRNVSNILNNKPYRSAPSSAFIFEFCGLRKFLIFTHDDFDGEG